MAPEALKHDLNQQFREKYPQVQISLSKLRRFKAEMLRMAIENPQLSLSSAVLAQLYFERLALLGHVTKANRDVYAATCCILAIKFNENKDDMPEFLDLANKFVEEAWGVPARDALELEFTAFVQLQCTLLVSDGLLLDALRRIVASTPNLEAFDEVDVRNLGS